jgi:hypothetical protein
MQSAKSIRDSAAAQNLDAATRWKLDMMVVAEETLELLVSCQKSVLDLKEQLRAQQQRMDALERDHDHVAEVCQDLADAVFQEEPV